MNTSTWSSRHTAICVSVSAALRWQDSCRQDCSRMKNRPLEATDWHWTICQQALQGVRNRPILKCIKMLFERNFLKDGWGWNDNQAKSQSELHNIINLSCIYPLLLHFYPSSCTKVAAEFEIELSHPAFETENIPSVLASSYLLHYPLCVLNKNPGVESNVCLFLTFPQLHNLPLQTFNIGMPAYFFTGLAPCLFHKNYCKWSNTLSFPERLCANMSACFFR